MLQLAQRTSAPSAVSVSMRTAVWIVMCSEPEIRQPASGFDSPNSLRVAIRPGISCSARIISLRPKGASSRSATRKSLVSARRESAVSVITDPLRRHGFAMPRTGWRVALRTGPGPSGTDRISPVIRCPKPTGGNQAVAAGPAESPLRRSSRVSVAAIKPPASVAQSPRTVLSLRERWRRRQGRSRPIRMR